MTATPFPSASQATSPQTFLTAPQPPSSVEAEYYYYGLYSKSRLIVRSSIDPWVEPRGAETYLTPKVLSPLGDHPLREIWEPTVGPKMVNYLDAEGVEWSSMDPVRIGHAGTASPPAILWIGVLPGSLTAEVGVKIAFHLKGILSAHGINDVHVELRESEVFYSTKLYQPVPTSLATARVIEPLLYCCRPPHLYQGDPIHRWNWGVLHSDPRHPVRLFLVTARHVVIPPDSEDNKLFKHTNTSARKEVLLFSDPAAEQHPEAIRAEISAKIIIIKQLERRLEAADLMEPEYAESEQDEVKSQLTKARKAIKALEEFLREATRDWEDRDDGFTEDWAIVDIDPYKIDSANFVGNAVDLGIDIPVDKFTSWVYPHPPNPHSFDYLGDRLHRFLGTIPDEEMWKPSPKTGDHEEDPVIMVMKRGYAFGLTVGRLNTIRSFTRYYFKDKLGMMSKEVAILPRNSESGPFSEPGDSGLAVVDGKGRLAGLLTGGAGVTDISDCTYVTSVNFLHARMLMHGLMANFFPSLDA